jgi:hypothetical protein
MEEHILMSLSIDIKGVPRRNPNTQTKEAKVSTKPTRSKSIHLHLHTS